MPKTETGNILMWNKKWIYSWNKQKCICMKHRWGERSALCRFHKKGINRWNNRDLKRRETRRHSEKRTWIYEKKSSSHIFILDYLELAKKIKARTHTMTASVSHRRLVKKLLFYYKIFSAALSILSVQKKVVWGNNRRRRMNKSDT